MAAHVGLDEQATRAVVGDTMGGLVDGQGLPPISAPRGSSELTLPGRLARAYGYGSLAGPALFAGATEQAQGMLDLAIAVCRDPDAGASGEVLDAIGAALIAARALLDTEGGQRPAIDLLFRAMAKAATQPTSATGQPTPPAPDALARASQGV